MKKQSEESQEEEKEVRVQVPGLVTDELIVEEIWDHTLAAPQFAVREFGSDRIETRGSIRSGLTDSKGREVLYVPIDNGHLRKGMVLVPDGPAESTFDDVYREACELAFEIYDCDKGKRGEFELLVAIAIGSWFLDRFASEGPRVAGMGMFAPIISIRGRSGSGKNRALNALRLSSYRPFYDLATVRTPSLYRPLDQWKGTLCLDECDVSGNENSDFVHLINSRCYGTPISRQNPDAPANADVFSSFGLTIVTQRRSWIDDATENRTVPHYATKSQKSLPTSELDSWIDRGLALQNKLLHLRLAHWDQVNIDKAARIEGVSDHRLTAAVLPLLALKDSAPDMVANLKEILLSFARKRIEVKAASTDGIIVNALWGRIEEGLFGQFNRNLYVGRERVKEKDVTGEETTYVEPLTTSDLSESLKWSSASALRRVVHGLQLQEKPPSDKIRVGKKVFNPIWFDSAKVEPLLRDFVIDYEDGALQNVLARSGLDMLPTSEPEQLEQPEQKGVSGQPTAQNVPVVPNVPVISRVGDGRKMQDQEPTEVKPARIVTYPCSVCGKQVGTYAEPKYVKDRQVYCREHFPKKSTKSERSPTLKKSSSTREESSSPAGR